MHWRVTDSLQKPIEVLKVFQNDIIFYCFLFGQGDPGAEGPKGFTGPAGKRVRFIIFPQHSKWCNLTILTNCLQGKLAALTCLWIELKLFFPGAHWIGWRRWQEGNKGTCWYNYGLSRKIGLCAWHRSAWAAFREPLINLCDCYLGWSWKARGRWSTRRSWKTGLFLWFCIFGIFWAR